MFEVQSREVDEVDGNLEEVDVVELRKRRRVGQGRADTMEELTELGKQRGYRRPRMWAHAVMQGRQRQKLGMK
jgi:hypothetical protein